MDFTAAQEWLVSPPAAGARPVWFASKESYPALRQALGPRLCAFADAAGFEPKVGQFLLVPDEEGGLAGALFGIAVPGSPQHDPFLAGRLPALLPPGVYRFANEPGDMRLAALAFAFGAYRFSRYRARNGKDVRLEIPRDLDAAELKRIVEAVVFARDLINTPANDMGPAELEEAGRLLAVRHGATFRSIVGDALLRENFPLVHAVGRGSAREPRLIELVWGEAGAPKVTLVGKGVCFDTGGLDIKPSSAMLLMKKDMGGAACIFAAAHMVMDRKLPVRLRVLVPAVENAVSGHAFRPLDVYRSRKGLSVEVGNTDAEGRLVLADALAFADEEAPDLLVDAGTLTGAARVALGPELPPFYTDDDRLAQDLARHAEGENDPLWRMPLWRPYESMLDSKVADLGNVSSGSFAGSITCALFLRRFVSAAKSWLHFDIYAWNPGAKPGRPEGGECQAARALYALLCERYG
ncbi:MAG TPA: leucyl aminopeptidase family protein [Xanthobacteraceae bacterium]|nr:leucyl aminopeptidase family protein [Xanthobacteraceae bacterium]